MTTRSQALPSQIEALPPEQQQVYAHPMLWLHTAVPAVANADPIHSARGVFAGGGLSAALMKHRLEELA